MVRPDQASVFLPCPGKELKHGYRKHDSPGTVAGRSES